jgi:hypothetical protein
MCLGDVDESTYENTDPARIMSAAPLETGTESCEVEVVVGGRLQRNDENSTVDEAVRSR